jgi:hypothetical protein
MFEEKCAEGWEGQVEGERLAVERFKFSQGPALVAGAASAVFPGVTVQDFLPFSFEGSADAVIEMGHRGEIEKRTGH